MSKRIITSYNKLNNTIKKAIQVEHPHGFEMQLTRMRHLIKGYFFDGFLFNHDDTTYLIECNRLEQSNNFVIYNDDEDDQEDLDLDETDFND